jgi:hypothetical protein
MGWPSAQRCGLDDTESKMKVIMKAPKAKIIASVAETDPVYQHVRYLEKICAKNLKF